MFVITGTMASPGKRRNHKTSHSQSPFAIPIFHTLFNPWNTALLALTLLNRCSDQRLLISRSTPPSNKRTTTHWISCHELASWTITTRIQQNCNTIYNTVNKTLASAPTVPWVLALLAPPLRLQQYFFALWTSLYSNFIIIKPCDVFQSSHWHKHKVGGTKGHNEHVWMQLMASIFDIQHSFMIQNPTFHWKRLREPPRIQNPQMKMTLLVFITIVTTASRFYFLS